MRQLRTLFIVLLVLVAGAGGFVLGYRTGVRTAPAPSTTPRPSDQGPVAAEKSAPIAGSTRGEIANIAASKLSDLPKLGAANGTPAGWDGVDGLHTELVSDAATAGGQPTLHLVTASTTGLHRIGARFDGLDKNLDYRVAVRVKPLAATRLLLELRDEAQTHHGVMFFDLATRSVSAKSGDVTAGAIETMPDGWFRIYADMRYGDGIAVVYLGLLNSQSSFQFKGDGRDAALLGGMEIKPLSR